MSQQGQIVTLIGSNGAGKSHHAAHHLLVLSSRSRRQHHLPGAKTSLGKSTRPRSSRSGVTLVPEGRRVFPDMTVLENLKIGAYLRKDDLSEDLEWVYSLFPRLKERSWQAGRHALRRRAADACGRPRAR